MKRLINPILISDANGVLIKPGSCKVQVQCLPRMHKALGHIPWATVGRPGPWQCTLNSFSLAVSKTEMALKVMTYILLVFYLAVFRKITPSCYFPHAWSICFLT